MESYTLRDKFDRIPDVTFPPEVTRAMRLDYGDETHLGRTVKLPAEQGEEYPAIVSDVDDDGNEVGGIRLPSVSVPPRHQHRLEPCATPTTATPIWS